MRLGVCFYKTTICFSCNLALIKESRSFCFVLFMSNPFVLQQQVLY